MSDWHSDHLLMTEDGSQFRLSLEPAFGKNPALAMIEDNKLMILLENSVAPAAKATDQHRYNKFPIYTDQQTQMVGLEGLQRDKSMYT